MFKLALVLALGALGYKAQAADAPVPMFADFQVHVSQGERVIYRASVIVPRNTEVKLSGVKTFPIKVTCPANNAVSGEMTYRDGVNLALRANGFEGKAITMIAYEIAMREGTGKMLPFGTCSRAEFSHKTISGRQSPTLKPGETYPLEELGNGIKVNLTLKGIYVEAPAGRSVGEFLEAR